MFGYSGKGMGGFAEVTSLGLGETKHSIIRKNLKTVIEDLLHIMQ